MRVTTTSKQFADSKEAKGLGYIRAGFDQEAAAVVMARWAIFKTQFEHIFEIRRWLDRVLIRLMQKFASFTPDQPNSFKLSKEFAYFPQFMFHLRRSQFMQVFNCTPDETAFFRIILCRENVSNSVVMIQPSLVAYSLDGPARPVNLDSSAMNPNCILLMDTYFHCVVWLGSNISAWHGQGVQNQPGIVHPEPNNEMFIC